MSFAAESHNNPLTDNIEIKEEKWISIISKC